MIPLDDQLRPTWLFGKSVYEGCDRAGYYGQGDFTGGRRSPAHLLICQLRRPPAADGTPRLTDSKDWVPIHPKVTTAVSHLHDGVNRTGGATIRM